MNEILLLSGAILVICVLSSKLLYKFGIPTLIIFLCLGMLLGSDGPGGIYFYDYTMAQHVCSLGLAFIMFYGGFGFNWKTAKPVVLQSVFLSTVGVVITAFLVGIFSWWLLKISLLEGMLLGAIVSSTDAASVFSILRSKKLNLKGGMASMLEMESGSNDPISYMLTIVILSLISNNGQQSIIQLLTNQILFGFLIGFSLALLAVLVMRHIRLEIDGLYPIFVTGIILLGYSLNEWLGGNGFLAVYIIGIVMGNSKILHKKSLVHFFDGMSWLMQIILFFTLGLLVFPSQLPAVSLSAIIIALFLIFVARPVAIFSILSWFKTPLKQQLLVSWVGLRGAASIVFATYALTNQISVANQIFNTVFFIALLSVLVQGTMLPKVAKLLDVVEKEETVYKTFSDYQDETHTKLIECPIRKSNPWAGKSIMEANIPEEILVVMIKRKGEVITPKGSTVINAGDTLVLIGNKFDGIRSGKE
ncbi:MAG TPA: potassium/proton antiporter [Clostridia bacterium]|nr:potassium/proton antiporter [Clostridia bacterium]